MVANDGAVSMAVKLAPPLLVEREGVPEPPLEYKGAAKSEERPVVGADDANNGRMVQITTSFVRTVVVPLEAPIQAKLEVEVGNPITVTDAEGMTAPS